MKALPPAVLAVPAVPALSASFTSCLRAVRQVLLPLSALVLVTLPARAEFDRASALRLAASVMKVEVIRAQGGYSLGSGVSVARELVATNCHVTREARDIYIVRGGQRWRVSEQAADLAHDLCVLRVPGMQAASVPLAASAKLALGQNALALGYTGGVELQHSFGDIVGLSMLTPIGNENGNGNGNDSGAAPGLAAATWPADGARVIQLRNGFNSGASGGGLFDEQMQLIGILTFRLRGGASHYFAAPTDWLQPLLADDAAFRPVAPLDRTALAYWQQPVTAQPLFLQAAVLEREQRWADLDRLASQWRQLSPADAQPAFMQGLALGGLQRWPESQQALERSLHLAPDYQDAWFRLGLAHQAQGHLDAARKALARLQALQSNLAAELESVLRVR